MKNEILDAINEATQQGKVVHSIRVTSPELWKQIHEDDYLRGFLTRTPGGLPAFAGVVMHYQASDSAAGFELEFD